MYSSARAYSPVASAPADAVSDAALDAAFLGPLAENAELLENLVVGALRDHVYWRRNFHPHDAAFISAGARYSPEYQTLVARTEHVLRRLAADLKDSAPWFSPRYIGHMASDLLIPGVVARFLALLYNPNNVSLDAGGPMLRAELEVGSQLARMVGYATNLDAPIRAWGHLTSGGTIANVEAIWRLRAVRLLPLAVARAVQALNIAVPTNSAPGHFLANATDWKLANMSTSDALALRRIVYEYTAQQGGSTAVAELHKAVESFRVENQGMADFLAETDISAPVVVAPYSAHYSWSKAMKLLGLGGKHLIGVDVDDHMRMSPTALRECLSSLAERQTPVIATIGVLGTTEFGTFDPINEIVAERAKRALNGQAFGVHVDAAWGGYLATLFRNPDGSMRPRDSLRSEYRYFPTSPVYEAFAALAETDSITIDPHKLGFIPYPAGAFVARDRRISALLSEAAPYVFDKADATFTLDEVRDEDLGRYIIEGSKPGSSAASVYAVHEVFPLHAAGFGTLLRRTILASEWLHDQLLVLAAEIADRATLIIPFEPDCNVVCLAVNPLGNRKRVVMNRFMRALFDTMRIRPDAPLQLLEFVGSYTSISAERLKPAVRNSVAARLGLASGELDSNGDGIFLLRHTLMNPWLLAGDPSPLEMYVRFLREQVETLLVEGPDDLPSGAGGS
jgi:glutamate/tyrosine decarboxylase-like PLP-dependent enzyme